MNAIFKICLTLICLGSGQALAHRYHSSLAEIEENHKTGNFEIAIQLFNHDLELVVGKLCAKQMTIEKNHSCSEKQLIQSYTRKRFLVRESHIPVAWRWRGMERLVHQTYLYLEVEADFKFDSFEFFHHMLQDFYPQQMNQVTRRTRPKGR